MSDQQQEPLKCADARHLIHLSVGDDTLSDEELRLSEHLHTCSDCRAYHAGTVDVMQVLERVRDDDSVDIPTGGVWAAIADSVKTRREQSVPAKPRRSFNGAVAALCACSLSLALITVVKHLPTADPDEQLYAPQAISVSNGGFSQQDGEEPAFMAIPQEDGSFIFVDRRTGQKYTPQVFAPSSGEYQKVNF